MSDVPFLDQAGCIALLARLPSLDAPDRATLDPILMLAASLVVLHERYCPVEAHAAATFPRRP